jgi:3-deoxy-D-manno-octulosonic-acid transferase
MLLIYTALLYVAAPVVFALTAWRGIRDPAYRDRLGERFGLTRLRGDGSAIWVHAVSVGEVQAAAPLIRALRQRHPQRTLIVTTTTPTGAQRVRALFPGTVRHAYLPYDLPGAVNRFLDRVRPQHAIVMETEVWPNLYRACARRGIPIALASARLSEKSVRRYRRFAGVFGPALRDLAIGAQTQADAQRFIAIGANPSRVHVTGNIKFDIEVPAQVQADGAALRSASFAGRKVWVAGSTHAGEEDEVLEAHRRVLKLHPDALLILVPRHPNRFDQVRTWLDDSSMRFVSRSRQERVNAGIEVLFADTLGELLMLYAAADVAFVGGSLVPLIGGHNLLEPAALAKPILTGPHHANGQDIAQLLLADGAAQEVRGADDLAAAVAKLFAHPERRKEMGEKAQAVVASNRGALARAMELIDSASTTSSTSR